MSIACVGEQEWVEIEGGRRRRNKILVYPRDGRHGSKDAEIKYDQILEKLVVLIVVDSDLFDS